MKRQTVDVNGIETGVLIGGEPDAPVVVLVHGAGLGMGAHSWFPAVQELTRYFRVVAPDLLGYGTTRKVLFFDRSPNAQRLDHLAQCCVALGLTEAAFVGHSMGGGLVLNGAICGILPATHLVSIAGPGGVLLDRARMAKVQTRDPDRDWARAACEVGVSEPTDEQIERRLEAALAPDHIAVLGSQGEVNRLHPRPVDHAERFLTALGGVTLPTLLVGGDQDPLVANEWTQVLGERLPRASQLMVQGAGHEPHVSHPELVVEAIVDHCRQPIDVTGRSPG